MPSPSTLENAPASSVPQREVPPWRSCVGRALRCWFGCALVVLAGLSLYGPDDLLPAVGGFLLMMLAVGVVSTLAALVIESLTARQVPLAGHVGLIAAATGIVVALFTLDSVVTIVAILVAVVGATIGALVTLGRPTSRRYLIALAVPLVAFGTSWLMRL